MMSLRPLGERVVVRPDEKSGDKKIGAIWVPQTVNSTNMQVVGTIVAVGAGDRTADGNFRRMVLRIGQRVVMGVYAGAEVWIDNAKHYVVRESDVLAVVEEAVEIKSTENTTANEFATVGVESKETHPLGGVQNKATTPGCRCGSGVPWEKAKK